MTIDTRTPEGRAREVRNAALIGIKRHLANALHELEYLINATPSGDRRNLITDVNIHVMAAGGAADKLQSEES